MFFFGTDKSKFKTKKSNKEEDLILDFYSDNEFECQEEIREYLLDIKKTEEITNPPCFQPFNQLENINFYLDD